MGATYNATSVPAVRSRPYTVTSHLLSKWSTLLYRLPDAAAKDCSPDQTTRLAPPCMAASIMSFPSATSLRVHERQQSDYGPETRHTRSLILCSQKLVTSCASAQRRQKRTMADGTHEGDVCAAEGLLHGGLVVERDCDAVELDAVLCERLRGGLRRVAREAADPVCAIRACELADDATALHA